MPWEITLIDCRGYRGAKNKHYTVNVKTELTKLLSSFNLRSITGYGHIINTPSGCTRSATCYRNIYTSDAQMYMIIVHHENEELR